MRMPAKNGSLSLGEGRMDYIRFGSGEKTLIILPGLGDGLRTVRGTAVPMALMYREFAGKYTVYAFSRRDPVPQGYTIRDMARDQMLAMDMLKIPQADVLGVSMGGMIAQQLAADYPERVEKLVLTVTAARTNPVMTAAIREWMDQALAGDHTALMDSNLRLIYSDAYYQKNRKLVPVLGRLTRPQSYDRFLVQAQACLEHDCYDRLAQIQSPTLVIGGEQDRCLTGDASREIAARIPGAELKMYPQWGHGLYEEAADFYDTVLDFLCP